MANLLLLSTLLISQTFLSTPHRRSTAVSVKISPLSTFISLFSRMLVADFLHYLQQLEFPQTPKTPFIFSLHTFDFINVYRKLTWLLTLSPSKSKRTCADPRPDTLTSIETRLITNGCQENKSTSLTLVLTQFESVNEIAKCDSLNEGYRAVLSCGAVYHAVQGDSNL